MIICCKKLVENRRQNVFDVFKRNDNYYNDDEGTVGNLNVVSVDSNTEGGESSEGGRQNVHDFDAMRIP